MQFKEIVATTNKMLNPRIHANWVQQRHWVSLQLLAALSLASNLEDCWTCVPISTKLWGSQGQLGNESALFSNLRRVCCPVLIIFKWHAKTSQLINEGILLPIKTSKVWDRVSNRWLQTTIQACMYHQKESSQCRCHKRRHHSRNSQYICKIALKECSSTREGTVQESQCNQLYCWQDNRESFGSHRLFQCRKIVGKDQKLDWTNQNSDERQTIKSWHKLNFSSARITLTTCKLLLLVKWRIIVNWWNCRQGNFSWGKILYN